MRVEGARLELILGTAPLELLLDEPRVRALAARALVEVLQLREVLALRNELLKGWGVLADAVPAAGGIADTVLRVGDPVLALLRDVHDLVHAHETVLRGVDLLEEPLVHPHIGGHVVLAELVEKGPCHHRRGLVEAPDKFE
eukprot:UN1048